MKIRVAIALGLLALGCDPDPASNNANNANNTNNQPDMPGPTPDASEDMIDITPPDMAPDMPIPVEADFKISTRPGLVWKRRDALTLDLSRALSLPADQLCNELGTAPCAAVHQVSLGANEPFLLGMYLPVGSPLATTPAVVDRMVLASCASAAKASQEGSAAVFEAIDWASATAPADAGALDAHTTELYQRFLSRDPSPAELTVARELAVDAEGQPLATEDYATLTCYAVGSLTEFVMY